jgi:hypothetical protein
VSAVGHTSYLSTNTWPINSGDDATTASETAWARAPRRRASSDSAVRITIAAVSRTTSESNARW